MPISALAKVGLAVEETWGAGGSPACVFPVEDWSLTGPFEQILDNAKRGVVAKDFQAYQGVGRAEASLEGEIYPSLAGYLLKALFGSVAVTGTVAPYTHTFTFIGSPPSIALTEDNNVEQDHGYGLMVSEYTLSMNPTDGALKYSASLQGQKLGTVSYTFPADVHEDDPFFLGWHGSVDLGGSYLPIIEGELTISREIALHYKLQNSQYAGTAYAGAPEITGSFTIDYNESTDYDRYRLHQQGSIDIYYTDGTYSLKFELGSVDFGEGAVELDKSGPNITLGYSWRALYCSDLSGPARAILVSPTASF